jgi:hypothetical protein
MGRDGKQTTEIGNRVFLPYDSGLRHHRHVDRQPIATEREKRTVDHLTQLPTHSHVESGQTIREEEGASRFESWCFPSFLAAVRARPDKREVERPGSSSNY